MAPEKKKGENGEPCVPRQGRTLREYAEERFMLQKDPPGHGGKTPDELIHELRVHQIELETQAEELRRAHLALEESRDKYLDLYEFAPLGYLTLTDKAIISEANLTSATLLGVDRRSLIRARFSRHVAERDSDRWHRYYLNVLDRREKLTCTLMLRRADDSLFPARLESIRIPGTGDDPPSVRVAISDITDIRQVEDALRISNNKLNLLSSVTRHDIKNQLLILSASVEMIRMDVADSVPEKDFIRVTDALGRITRIIQFTKEYEKIGLLAPSWQDCRMLADTAIRQGGSRQISVKNDLPAGREVYADELIARVFYNLVENAIRHGGKITTIRFFLQEPGGDHIIVCEDDGDGVADGDKNKIFDRGFGKNSGLGLTLARDILSITGITIRETGEPGKGARFEMAVPREGFRLTRQKPGG